ncbi:MAG: hypothetical protein HN413_07985 [Chloroflexi bacterium]|jgi:hypothetical protein|nr:hypothetical protein [Chloroflexota bacterium]
MTKPDLGIRFPDTLAGFYQRHQGETCLVICNGPSLNELPMGLLEQYPSIGCNTICEWYAFEPWYYVAVDDRVRREYGDLVLERFAEIPKFIPTPNLDKWQGAMFYRWFHRPGPLWPYDKRAIWPAEIMSKPGITWACVPHVMMQLAFFMGFTTILIVGMDHSDDYSMHAWGRDDGMLPRKNPSRLWALWEAGHNQLYEGFMAHGVEMINITPGTQERSLPKDDWRKWYAPTTEAAC